MKESDNAPSFMLNDQDGKKHSLRDYLGDWVLLYFYPRDDTPGCVKEACGIRDVFSEYKKEGITVLGVSADSVESHKKFEQKYQLPFPLLSNEDKTVLKKYGVWKSKKMFGKTKFGIARTSFLINPQGKIQRVYKNVKPELHAGEVLNDTKELKVPH